jgi:hypothetical protein
VPVLVSHNFWLDSAPEQAQVEVANFAIEAMRKHGFKLGVSPPGMMHFEPSFLWADLLFGLGMVVASMVGRGGQSLSITFEQEEGGTRVSMFGRVPRRLARGLEAVESPAAFLFL